MGLLFSCGGDGSQTDNTPSEPKDPSSISGNAPAMRAPVRLDMSPEGNLVISDHSTGGVYVLKGTSAKGAFGFLAGNGSPLAVATDAEGIYVGSRNAGNIDLWSYSGQFRFRLVKPGVIGKPSDMAIDGNTGTLFVVDTKGKDIKVFNLSGTFIDSFPPSDAPAAQALVFPTAIALDTVAQRVYVSDYLTIDPTGLFKGKVNARVQIYDYSGAYIASITSTNLSAYGFSRPQGLAVTPGGYLLMTDSILGSVLIFNTTTLAGVKKLGSHGTGIDQLTLPLDVYVDPGTLDVHVTDNMNGRITTFEGGGVIP